MRAHVGGVDRRACGRSQSGPEASWTLDRWADDVAEFVRLLNIRRPTVLGTSFGRMLAQHFAARQPSLLRGLVLSRVQSNPPVLSEELMSHRGTDRKQLVCIEECSHFAEQDAPARIIDAILRFFPFAQIEGSRG